MLEAALVEDNALSCRGRKTMSTELSMEWIEVTVDCVNVEVVAEFWRQLLGLSRLENPLPGWARTTSTVPGGPVLTFQPVPEPKMVKSRIHLDLRVDNLPSAVHKIRALGGDHSGETHVYDEGTVAVMVDPEGTEFCVIGPPGSTVPEPDLGG
jgi:predicted enzyme related to lactoylglutathione lyase